MNGPAGTDYHYTYTYGAGGNIDKRKNENGGAARNYVYDIDDTPNDGRHYHALESVTGDGLTASFINDPNGNMSSRTMGGVTYAQVFDVENRLASVTVNGQTTVFYYDAGGNRTLTIQPNGTKVYTPFPEFEETVPTSGATTQRASYYLAGQLIAVRVTTRATSVYSYAYTDHLGNVVGLGQTNTWLANSQARYDPFGNFRTTPDPTINPDVTNVGFTGHRHNNTGSFPVENVGLIYMNARYYMPEIGRFVSPDTIVPDPANPQSFNRYSYSYNNPINYIDPSGHDPLDAAWEEAFCNEHFGGMAGCTITDDNRRDRLFSVIFCGSGASCAWTGADWAFYSDNRKDLWNGITPWLNDLSNGLDRFLAHLDRLASYYNPSEASAFVEAVGNVWGGIPFGPPVGSAIQTVGGPVVHPVLVEGNANWVLDMVEGGQDATHHYAGLFYTGYFFGAGPAAAINWFRDGPISGNNPPDLHLGYVAGLQGNMLARGFISPSELSTVARFALDVRLDTWYEPTQWSDYRNYWFYPYSGQ